MKSLFPTWLCTARVDPIPTGTETSLADGERPTAHTVPYQTVQTYMQHASTQRSAVFRSHTNPQYISTTLRLACSAEYQACNSFPSSNDRSKRKTKRRPAWRQFCVIEALSHFRA
jgi:hypothetical protein